MVVHELEGAVDFPGADFAVSILVDFPECLLGHGEGDGGVDADCLVEVGEEHTEL